MARLSRSLALVLAVSAAAASAQVALPGFDLERLALSPGGKYTLLQQTGDQLERKELRISIIGHYEHDPLVITINGKRAAGIISSRVTTHLMAAIGIFDWLEVGLHAPIIVLQLGDDLTKRGLAPVVGTTTFGSPSLQARGLLLRQLGSQPVDLGLTLGVTFPFGTAEALTKDPDLGLAFTPRLGVGHRFNSWFRLGGEIGAVIRGSVALSPGKTMNVTDEVGSNMSIGVDASGNQGPMKGELGVRTVLPFTKQYAAAELQGAFRYAFAEDQLEAFVMGAFGIGRAPGTPLFRALLGVAWTPKFVEGVQAEKVNAVCVEGTQYPLQDCPMLDRDDDGLLNRDDECPDVKGTLSMRGCPDGDDDGDTVPNSIDQCRAVKGITSNNGCPPIDTDADGIIDNDDACPEEKGVADLKGCPVRDADGDSVADDQDACPKVKGLVELKGCPEVDADHDTVLDKFDNCPTEFGDVDNSGCPKAKKQLVVITNDKLFIKEKVFFATGKAAILPKSFPLLTQVAEVLKLHADLGRITVEGHTDNKGKRDANVKLSQARADAVKKFVVDKGVPAERITAVGYGPDKPADTNETEKGRDNNRRVEFVVEKAATSTKVETKPAK